MYEKRMSAVEYEGGIDVEATDMREQLDVAWKEVRDPLWGLHRLQSSCLSSFARHERRDERVYLTS